MTVGGLTAVASAPSAFWELLSSSQRGLERAGRPVAMPIHGVKHLHAKRRAQR